jgi:hypothetical protein
MAGSAEQVHSRNSVGVYKDLETCFGSDQVRNDKFGWSLSVKISLLKESGS